MTVVDVVEDVVDVVVILTRVVEVVGLVASVDDVVNVVTSSAPIRSGLTLPTTSVAVRMNNVKNMNNATPIEATNAVPTHSSIVEDNRQGRYILIFIYASQFYVVGDNLWLKHQ
jgi:hypothetical protein